MSSLQKGIYNKMRTIKFRLIKDNKVVSTQELKPNGIIDCPVEWDIACQFTGLLDKQGKEIYEGDIVKRWIGMKEFSYEIKWYQESYVMWNKNKNWLPLMLYGTTPYTNFSDKLELLEVIGNIYENSELLENKNAKRN